MVVVTFFGIAFLWDYLFWNYVNHELSDVQARFRKGRGTKDQIASIRWIIEKAREFQKNIYFCFIDYAKTFDCVKSEVTQSCSTLSDPMDCSLPGSSVYGIFQARVLEWVAISFSRSLPNPGIEPGSPFDCVDHHKLWEILKRDGAIRPPYLLPDNLYEGQEAC